MKLTIAAFVLIAAAAFPRIAAAQAAGTVAFSAGINVEMMSDPVAFESEPVTGAPYSAEAVTEIVQTLADGNRIVRESKAEISRDGKGRTRREQSFGMLGGFFGNASGAEAPRHVQISDPETKTTTMLDMQSKTAHRIPAPNFKFVQGGANGPGLPVDHFEIAVPPPPGGAAHMGVQVFKAREAAMAAKGGGFEPVVEELGSQFMEGVTVEGRRTTITIPAGQIGNELPIKMVSERWFSPELKVLVMSKQSDPRFGETTYRLTNVTRAEPSPDLFEVPSDFKVVEPNRDMLNERRFNKMIK